MKYLLLLLFLPILTSIIRYHFKHWMLGYILFIFIAFGDWTHFQKICMIIHLCIKGQMHHHDDLGSKCANTCHLSNKTTRQSVLLSTPQKFKPNFDWSRDISGSHFQTLISLNQSEPGLAVTSFHRYLSTNQNWA